mmetsp:Transcript_42567/g.132402  ORF Transcript_42567/g.132402 Transcript_42567/m.132402 type:complete len:206 (-) Transcript_42567:621-1238(-)
MGDYVPLGPAIEDQRRLCGVAGAQGADDPRLWRLRQGLLQAVRRPREALDHAERALVRRALLRRPLRALAEPEAGPRRGPLHCGPQAAAGSRGGRPDLQVRVQGAGRAVRHGPQPRVGAAEAGREEGGRGGCAARSGFPARLVCGPSLLRGLSGQHEGRLRGPASTLHRGGEGAAQRLVRLLRPQQLQDDVGHPLVEGEARPLQR